VSTAPAPAPARPTPARIRGALARVGAAMILWGPLLLWMTVLVPAGPDTGGLPLRLHAGVALLLALIGAQIVRQLFTLPVAAGGPGRFRVVPARPGRPFLMATAGVACGFFGLWSLWTGSSDLVALGALPSGLLSIWLARQVCTDPVWGTWLEISGDALRVHCPRAEDWSVPLSRIVQVRLRPSDRSYLVRTPWPERDVFVPSSAARARYAISNHEALLGLLAERAPVEETPDLIPPAPRPTTA